MITLGLILLVLLSVALGLFVGWYTSLVKRYLQKIVENTKPRPQSGVTAGAYSEGRAISGSSAIVSPKTPQQLEWERTEDIKRRAL